MIGLLWALAGCKSGEVWEETTVPFDPTCARCESIGRGNLGHAGDVELFVDPGTDDPVAQWAACSDSLLVCLADAGPDELEDCVEDAQCPDTCKKAFRKEARTDDPTSALAAIDAVFFRPGGRCEPPDPRNREET